MSGVVGTILEQPMQLREVDGSIIFCDPNVQEHNERYARLSNIVETSRAIAYEMVDSRERCLASVIIHKE
jgi:hypothetical protein